MLKPTLSKSTHIHVVSMSVYREGQVAWGTIRWVGLGETAYFLWLFWGRLVQSELVHVWSHFMGYYCIQSFHCHMRGRSSGATIACLLVGGAESPTWETFPGSFPLRVSDVQASKPEIRDLGSFLSWVLVSLLKSQGWYKFVGNVFWSFPGGSVVKNLPAKQETWVQSLGRGDPLEEEMATHSSMLILEIPRTEEPGGLQSTGSQKSQT